MPVDKSRIQGFGSDGSVTTGSSLINECPQGHPLRRWTARQGWCDKCSQKVKSGEQVMDCRICNWYLCPACRPLGDEDSSIWGTLSSMADQVAGPGALDSFAAQVNDVFEAATEEINEMGSDIKSFVNTAMGLEESEDEEPPSTGQAAGSRRPDAATGPQRQEAVSMVSEFCEKYPAVRVAPKPDELEGLLTKCSSMNPSAMASAMYEQLSFSSGELEWQPRLRVLYVLEHCHAKGGGWRDIAKTVGQQGDELIKHLTEVQQCREKAIKVFILLLGKAAASTAGIPVPSKEEEDAAVAAAAAAKAQAKAKAAAPKAAPDLLDMAPSAGASASAGAADAKAKAKGKAKAKPAAAKAGAAATAAFDLLGGPAEEPAAPMPSLVPDLDLLNSAFFSAPAAGAGTGILGDLMFPSASSSAASPSPAADPLAAAFDPNGCTPGGGGGGGGGGGMGGSGFDAVAAAFGSMSLGSKSGAAASPAAMGFAALSQANPYPSMGPPAAALNHAAGLSALGGMGRGGSMGGGPMGGGPMGGFGGPVGGSMGGFGGAMGGGSMGGVMGGGPLMGGFGGLAGSPTPPTQPMVSAAGRGSGGYNIPKASELTPMSSSTAKDPFDFVTQHTGLTGGAK